MPYIATRPLQDKGVLYEPGDIVPDVETWPTFRAVLDLEWVRLVAPEDVGAVRASLTQAMVPMAVIDQEDTKEAVAG